MQAIVADPKVFHPHIFEGFQHPDPGFNRPGKITIRFDTHPVIQLAGALDCFQKQWVLGKWLTASKIDPFNALHFTAIIQITRYLAE
jgi:hypothetical protein